MIQSEGRHHIDEVSLRIEKQSGLTHITAIHTPSNLNIPLKCVSRHSEIQLSIKILMYMPERFIP